MSLKNGFGCRNLFVVIRPDVLPRELDSLANSAPAYVLVRIATHAVTWRSTLSRLAKNANPDVRCAVGENPHTPREVLLALALDADCDVRYSLAENHRLPEAVLTILAADENPYVSARANKTLRRLSSSAMPAPQAMLTAKRAAAML